jgi:hypothetical protein
MLVCTGSSVSIRDRRKPLSAWIVVSPKLGRAEEAAEAEAKQQLISVQTIYDAK